MEEAVLGEDLVLYYRLAPGVLEGLLVDERGRTALEAFGSLPFGDVDARIETYRARLRDAGRAWEAAEAISALDPLASFIRTFGPVGVEWGMEFTVRNPIAERLEREVDRLQLKAVRATPRAVDATNLDLTPPAGPQRRWTVSFWGHGPGRDAVPTVRRESSILRRPWIERVRLGDQGLPQDFLPRVIDEQRDLRRTLELADAVARRDESGCKSLMRSFLGEAAELWVGRPRPFQVDYGRAFRGLRGERSEPLFTSRSHRWDWVVLGRLLLAELITRQVDFAMPRLDVSDWAQFEVRWRPASLLELIYLELLEHLRRRPDFGVGWCGRCGGPILRNRRPGLTANQWHRGCRGGRVERWRAEHPDWRSGSR